MNDRTIYDGIRRLSAIVWSLLIINCRGREYPVEVPPQLKETRDFIEGVLSNIDAESLDFNGFIFIFWDALRTAVWNIYGSSGLSVLSAMVRSTLNRPHVSHLESIVHDGIRLILGGTPEGLVLTGCSNREASIANQVLERLPQSVKWLSQENMEK